MAASSRCSDGSVTNRVFGVMPGSAAWLAMTATASPPAMTGSPASAEEMGSTVSDRHRLWCMLAYGEHISRPEMTMPLPAREAVHTPGREVHWVTAPW